MATHEILNVVTLIMCVVTLTIASLALMPQIKQGLTIVRDSVLWAVLLGIVIVVGVIGWNRLVQSRQGRTPEVVTDVKPSVDYRDLLSESHSDSISDHYRALRRSWDQDSLGSGFPSFDRRGDSSHRGVR